MFKSFIGRLVMVVVYFDGILVYIKSKKDHEDHRTQVFPILRKQIIFANMKKCEFFVNSLVFLGYVVSAEGVKVNPSKVEAIRSWPEPQTIEEV